MGNALCLEIIKTYNMEDSSDSDVDSDRDIRKQRVLNDDVVTNTALTGVSQADRIIDKVSEIKEELQKNNQTIETQKRQIDDLSSRIDELNSKYDKLNNNITRIEEESEREFESIEEDLTEISENAGINLPAGVRRKITLPVGIGLLAFSIFSGGIAVYSGDPIPLYVKMSTAATVGLLSLELIEYIN